VELARTVVIAIFALWLVGTLVHQLDYPWAKGITGHDLFRLLPRWTFFAPNPGTSDYHLVFRERNGAGDVSPFLELPMHARGRWAFAINPDKRVKKALMDFSIMLNQHCASDDYDENNIRLTFSYLGILNLLSRIPLDPATNSIQFGVLVSDGFTEVAEPRLLLCSEFHDVRSRQLESA
jgi:hypothetical protein